MSKIQLRKKLFATRSKIPTKEKLQAAQSAAANFTQLAIFKESKRIACYLSANDEFDSTPVIEAIWQAKKHCYLPVLSAENNKELFFVRYEYGDALHANRYSILEPVNISRRIAAENLELVITPLVAFDAQGHRLGTGGGYYDRTFAFIHAHPAKPPFMLGLAYESQEAESIPTDPWDISLNAVLTEKRCLNFA